MAEICSRAGISQATYFNWKKKYDGLLPIEMKRLKQLEDADAAEKLEDCGARLPCYLRSYSEADLERAFESTA